MLHWRNIQSNSTYRTDLEFSIASPWVRLASRWRFVQYINSAKSHVKKASSWLADGKRSFPVGAVVTIDRWTAPVVCVRCRGVINLDLEGMTLCFLGGV